MYIIVAIMSIGILLGYCVRSQVFIIKQLDGVITYAIYLLLFLLGIAVGNNNEIIRNLTTIGLSALYLTIGAVLGSVVLAYFTYILFFKKDEK